MELINPRDKELQEFTEESPPADKHLNVTYLFFELACLLMYI